MSFNQSIVIDQGASKSLTFNLYSNMVYMPDKKTINEAKSTRFNLSGYTAKLFVSYFVGCNEKILTFENNTINATSGDVTINIAPASTLSLIFTSEEIIGKYNLEITNGSIVHRPFFGKFTIRKEIKSG